MLPINTKNLHSGTTTVPGQPADASKFSQLFSPDAGVSPQASETHNPDGSTSITASEDVNGQTVKVSVTANTEDAAMQAAHDALTSASKGTAGQSGNSLLPTGNEPPGVSRMDAVVTNDSTQEASEQALNFSDGKTTDDTGSTLAAGALTINVSLDLTRRGDGTYSATGTGQALGNRGDAATVTGTSASSVFSAAGQTLNTNLNGGTPTAGADNLPGVSTVTAVAGTKTGTTATAQGAFRTYDSSGRATGAQQTGQVGTVTDGSHALGLALQGASQNVNMAASVDSAARADVNDPNVQDAAHQLAMASAKGTGSAATVTNAYNTDLANYIRSKGKDPNNLSATDSLRLSTQFSQAVHYAMQNQQT